MFKLKIPSIIKLPESKKFEFIPRFYDPANEKKSIKDEVSYTGTAERSTVYHFRKTKNLSAGNIHNAVTRFIIGLTMLFVLLYWLLQ